MTLCTQQTNKRPAGNAESGNDSKLENGTGQKPNAPKSELADPPEKPCATRQLRKPGDTESGYPVTQAVLPMLGNSPLARRPVKANLGIY